MTEEETKSWSSFMPALLACVGATSGGVLELGVGHFSTPALHALCGEMGREMGRDLVSVEENEEWFNRFELLFVCYWHKFHHSDYNSILPMLSRWNWSVAFIDHSPGGKSRADAFKALLPVSEYVIVHDAQEGEENWEHLKPLLVEGVKWHVTKTYHPHTLVASLTRGIPKSILCL